MSTEGEEKDKAFEARYEKLNEAQKQAVDTIEGPVLVVAGPGSGKTEILSMRAANILRETDSYASSILCLTFTESAEVNMRKRLVEIIGPEGYRVGVHTFHNFCKDIKNRYPEHFEESAFFGVADDIVKIEILEEIFAQMDHDNPLRSEHPDFGFIYLKPAKSAISDLKQAGLTPDEVADILEQNEKFVSEFADQVDHAFSLRTTDDETIPTLTKLAEDFSKYEAKRIISTFRPLSEVLAAKLTKALSEAADADSTKPITAFKNAHTKKVDGKRVLKAGERERAKALVDVYRQYEQEKYRRGYHDFDDLILDVIQELEHNETLTAAVSEEFQYIEVDEFQDTNDAQLRLLMAVAGEDPENRPNLMVVGDDDQSIYRFQGAEVSNIINFKDYFADPVVVTLVKNYRSTQQILDHARAVITQGDERLETLLPEIEKELESSGDIAKRDSDTTLHTFSTRTHHNRAVAQIVGDLIEDGTEPDEIAVIGRYHKDLEQLVPYFHEMQIPIAYKRQQNVLVEPHIRQLIVMCRFVSDLARSKIGEAESYLPEILSFPFWNLPRRLVWELSLTANDKDDSLLELMSDHKNPKLNALADFFIEVAQRATHEPVEQVLDMLIGAHASPSGAENADGDEIELPDDEVGDFVSPFKDYYFSQDKLSEDPAEYLRFLSSLKTFVFALREHKEGQVLSVHDLVAFVDTHEKNNELVTDTSPFINAEQAVTLTTAHGAKGLEFDAVILAGAVDDIWAKSSRHRKVYFPENLAVSYEGDTADDYIRLLYVAMTRARHCLHIVSFDVDDSGEEKTPLSFLAETDLSAGNTTIDLPSTTALLESTVPSVSTGPYVDDEKALLLPLIENYRLSVTHLNNFLDVRYGGPQQFLTSNLLRFPQPMNKHAVYGSAIHKTLERAYSAVRQNEKTPTTKQVLSWFETELRRFRISMRDFEYLKERGDDALTVFWKQRKGEFKPDHKSEFSFSREGVAVKGVPLSGKIDKITPKGEEEVVVHDFKTGSSFSRWSSSYAKALNYKRQLIFYKLLVENSRTFSDKRVNEGVLEFVEQDGDDIVVLSYEITEDDVAELSELIAVVYEHITNLDFPDTSGYDESAKGIKQFEDDLLSGDV